MTDSADQPDRSIAANAFRGVQLWLATSRRWTALLAFITVSAGCDEDRSIPRETRLADDRGCVVADMAFCASDGVPFVFRADEPGAFVCLAAQETVELGRVTLFHPFAGTTRVTAEYDQAGRVVAIDLDCGLDEPWRANLIWDELDRLVEYSRPPRPDLPGHQRTFSHSEGLIEAEYSAPPGAVVDTVMLDADGRPASILIDPLTTEYYEYEPGYLDVDYAYDGDLLRSWSNRTNPETVGYDFEYQDGRLVTMHWGPTGELAFTFDWRSATEVTMRRLDLGYIAEVVLDDAGRPLQRDMFDGDDWVGVQTWAWEDDGRLREFVHHVP